MTYTESDLVSKQMEWMWYNCFIMVINIIATILEITQDWCRVCETVREEYVLAVILGHLNYVLSTSY